MTKRPKKINPTQRQRRAVQGIFIDKKTARQALIDAGYSEQTAKTPQIVTRSAGYLKILDEIGLNEHEVASRFKKLVLSADDSTATANIKEYHKVTGKHDVHRTRTTFNAPVLIQITPPNDPHKAIHSDIIESD